jgi:hypothetical protein
VNGNLIITAKMADIYSFLCEAIHGAPFIPQLSLSVDIRTTAIWLRQQLKVRPTWQSRHSPQRMGPQMTFKILSWKIVS